MARLVVDMHVHLLAGLDDGPRTQEDAREMGRMLVAEGVSYSVALAHQNEEWPAVTPDRIRQAAGVFIEGLRNADIPLEAFPCSEVMAYPELVADWKAGKLMSVADRGQWVLIEFPHNMFIDLRTIIRDLRALGVRTILAHAERTPEFLHEPGMIEEWIGLGCLVQVSASSITSTDSSSDEKALRNWFKRDIVHMLGTDAHSPRRRAPRIREAVDLVHRWVGASKAEAICGGNGLSILRGLPPIVVPPTKPTRTWFSRLFG